MLNVALCDDNTLHLTYTAQILQNSAVGRRCAVRQFERAEALLFAMQSEAYHPDIAILDIKMDNIDGITLAQYINHIDSRCQIIFLTGFLQYATQAYDAEHVYYVLKSELNTRFEPALERAVKMRGLSLKTSVLIKTLSGSVVIELKDILYLERRGRKTQIVTKDATYQTYQPPADILSQCDKRDYAHCHQSYYVNLASVNSMSPGAFTLVNGVQLPISRSFAREAKEQFLAYYSSSS